MQFHFNTFFNPTPFFQQELQKKLLKKQLKQCTLGVDEKEIKFYLSQLGIPPNTQKIYGKGIKEIYTIFWWGACMADVMMHESGATDSRNLQMECGHFNLSIALFDTIVDDYPIRKHHIFHHFDPENIIQSVPDIWNKTKKDLAPELNLVLKIICDFIQKLIARHHEEESQIRELNLLLKRMYLSEMEQSDSLADSKVLPIKFIGRYASNLPDDESSSRLNRKMAEFIAWWDDWIDLKSDIKQGQKNVFLSKIGWVRFFQKFVFGSFLFQRRIYAKISNLCDEVFVLTLEVPKHRRNKILNFLSHLICDRPTIFKETNI